ncbi:hypothetical protein HMPREF1550_02352 [Actinomyces sp. oral taxon 877 str. F0543]|nr:hypothetical protein HMPREF1550_02352 [Actinomyces sp. oral taxon 877 str. F0543]
MRCRCSRPPGHCGAPLAGPHLFGAPIARSLYAFSAHPVRFQRPAMLSH